MAIPFKLAAILLAAGRSSRMGHPKMLLPWGEHSILGHLVHTWKKLGATQIAVVLAEDDALMQSELDRLGLLETNRITNPTPDHGMFSSIRCAARWQRWQPELTHWAIVLGDQPHLSPSTLRQIIEFSATNPDEICVPRQGGHRRHPVILPKIAFLRLAQSTAPDLKNFLDHPPVHVGFCELNDPALELDIDRPEDYEQAKRMFGVEGKAE